MRITTVDLKFYRYHKFFFCINKLYFVVFVFVIAIAHQQVCIFQVLFPEGPDLPLPSNVPNIELHAMRGNTFNVEALKLSTK